MVAQNFAQGNVKGKRLAQRNITEKRFRPEEVMDL